MRKLGFILALIFVIGFANSVFAQHNDESKGFYRIGVGTVDFEHSTPAPSKEDYGHDHYHEAGLTVNLGLGYGTDKLRALVFLDPTFVDGVKGTSIISAGAKGEVGVPKIPWLKLGGGVVYSHNHAKLSDDKLVYERADLDKVFSPFVSVTFLPRSEGRGRFFADIRVGPAYGGDVIQPQTGKPVASIYVSVSLGVNIRFKDTHSYRPKY